MHNSFSNICPVEIQTFDSEKNICIRYVFCLKNDSLTLSQIIFFENEHGHAWGFIVGGGWIEEEALGQSWVYLIRVRPGWIFIYRFWIYIL